ncbi:hypothetical protein [Sphingobium yanoikuyae]|uniref:hypothetical protein n=1 Tax=Sphingobium TaxID=165695 RepID=UPI0028AF8735|nr:hypothetical protein [Sphingobium yanoikuyae]
MTRRQTRNRPTVGKSKAVATVDQIKVKFSSYLSPALSDHAKGQCFGRAVLFLMRDDYDGQLIFEAWQIGKVMRALARSAEIQAGWPVIGNIENHIDELMPEMAGVIVEIIAFKAVIRDKEAWQAFEELLPDRFLKAALRSFGRNKVYPPFFTHVDPYDWRATPKTNFTGLLCSTGGDHG